MIRYGKQSINEDDIRAVESVLRSDYLTCGPKVTEFETALAEYIGVKYVIAVSNGTAALHLLAMALKPTSVYVPDITFMATANAFAHVHSNVHLIDVGSDQPLLPTGSYNGLAVPVHLAGFPVDTSKFSSPIIEDGCHALGSLLLDSNRWTKVGSCKHSIATVFSFHPVKPITTGEGGAITTNDEALAITLRQLRSHGIEDEHYTVNSIGLNYRMTEIQAALGISQLKRLDSFIERRREIASKYDLAFKELGIIGIKELPFQRSGYHLYTIKVPNQAEVRAKLLANGISTQIHYKPLHKLEYYQSSFSSLYEWSNSVQWYNTTISIPIYPDLTDESVKFIINTVKDSHANI